MWQVCNIHVNFRVFAHKKIVKIIYKSYILFFTKALLTRATWTLRLASSRLCWHRNAKRQSPERVGLAQLSWQIRWQRRLATRDNTAASSVVRFSFFSCRSRRCGWRLCMNRKSHKKADTPTTAMSNSYHQTSVSTGLKSECKTLIYAPKITGLFSKIYHSTWNI